MAWAVLVLSAVFEAVWATALGGSDGLTETGPTVVFVLALTASMAGLAVAMRQIPVSVAYSVWVGVGAALTVGYAMATGEEPVTVGRVVFLTGIIGCVIGLRLIGPTSTGPDRPGG